MTTKVIKPGVTRANPDLLNRDFYVFGHSYTVAYSQSTHGYNYVEEVRDRLQVSNYYNYGVGGRTMQAVYDIAVQAWNHNPEAIVLLDAMLNTMRVEGTGPGSVPTVGVNADATQMERYRKDLSRFLNLVQDAHVVFVMEQPYLPQSDYDYLLATYGVPFSNAIIDTFNAVVSAEAAKYPNVFVVSINSRGVRPNSMIVLRHPTDAGHIFEAWQIDRTMGEVVIPAAPAMDLVANPQAILDWPWKTIGWLDNPGWAHPADGAAIAQLDDGSGNGWHFPQATVGNRPTYDQVNPAFNNKATAHLNGAASQFVKTANWGTMYPPYTIVMIGKSDTTATMVWTDGLDADHRAMLRKVGVANRRIVANVNLEDKRVVNASITTGSNRILAAAGTFTPADHDKSITGTGFPGGGTAVSTYINSGELQASVNASQTVVGGAYTLGFRDKNIPVLWVACFNDDKSWFEINGERRAFGDTNNATILHTLQGLIVGRDALGTSPVFGDLALVAVLPGEIPPEYNYQLQRFGASYYSLPIVPVPPPVVAPLPPPDIPGALTILNPKASYYAGGSWAHPADGDTAGTWPDMTVNDIDMFQVDVDHQAEFSVNGLSGRQCFRFDDEDYFASALFASVPQPYTLIAVAYNDDVGTGTLIDGGIGSQRGIIKYIGGAPGTGHYRIFGGKIVDSVALTDHAPHLFVAVFDGVASYLEVDGLQVLAGDAGTDPIQGLTLGGAVLGTAGSFLTGGMGLAILLPYKITAPENTALKSWTVGEYGIPMKA